MLDTSEANGESIFKKLDLSEAEIAVFPKIKNLSQQRKHILQLPGFFFLNFDSETSLRLKLHHEARTRRLRREAEGLPSLEDVEVFRARLLSNAKPSKVGDLDMVFYDGYKAALHLAPIKIQEFLSTKVFVRLQVSCDWDRFGRVPVSWIISYVLKKREKMKFLIALYWYDSSYQGYLTDEDLKEYLVEQVLPRIPSLAEVVGSPMQEHYLCMATRKFFFLLDQKNFKKLRIIDIAASGLLEEMLSVSEYSKEVSVASYSVEYPWFSKENFEAIQKLYLGLDVDGSGLLCYEELKNFRQITNFFVKRIFEMVQTYEHNQIDLRGFCDLLIAMDNKSDLAALSFYFRLLDVDGDGYLNAADLSLFYRDIAKLYEETYPESEPVPPFEDVKDEIFDMCRPKDPSRISYKELIDSGKGETIVGMLTDLSSFLAYECREDVGVEE